MYRALTFDGGGICGILSLVVLRRLLHEHPTLLEEVDLFAGASTGGIIALGLADDIMPAVLQELYMNKGREIFKPQRWTWGGLRSAKYVNKGLRRLVEEVFANHTLGDLKGKVLIPAFDLQCSKDGKNVWYPKFFSNWDNNDVDCLVPAREVAMYTSAAPTFFPSYDGFIDGGVAANNPCTAAMAMLLNPKVVGRRTSRRDLKILSIGTGMPAHSLDKRVINWGLLKWGTRIADVFMDGIVDVATYQCRATLQEGFCRVNQRYDVGVRPGMDDWKQAAKLVELGNAVDLTEALEWLETEWVEKKEENPID